MFEAVLELAVPFVVKYMINDIVNNSTLTSEVKVRQLWIAGGLLLGFAIGGFLTTIIAQYMASVASQHFGTDLRDDLYKKINSLSFKEIDKISSASLITRLQSDVLNVQNSVAMLIRLALRAPFIVIGATIMSFFVNVNGALIILAATLLLFLSVIIVMKIMVPYSRKSQAILDDVTRISKENLSGNRVVRAYNKENYERGRFVKVQDRLLSVLVKLAVREASLNPLTFLIVYGVMVLVIFICGKQYPSINIGEIQALVSYLTEIQVAVVAVTGLVLLFTKASASASRVNEVLALESSITYGKVDAVKDGKEVIEFKDVTFNYYQSQVPALNHISFTINKGETIGIIGGTGSGKSTIVSLINRFYDATSGQVLLYKRDIKDYTSKALFTNLSTVMQKAVLFSGTIKSNLLKAKNDASEEELAKALKIAQADSFVANLANGINSEVYQSGKNLSGGQRQRLSIARALVKDAPILILDDSSSALDYKTDANLRKAISELNKTIIIISQRARSIMKADKILVLEKGSLVGVGKHNELLKTNKIYQEICASQDVLEVAHV